MIKTNIKRLFQWRRLMAVGALLALVFVSLQHPLSAQSVSQGYDTDSKIERGMIVQIKEDDATKIEITSQATMDRAHGVVVAANDAPVTLSTEGSKTFVATTGHFEVLVSSQAGEINPGDHITVSAIDGIGMKAGEEEPIVVARSLEAFDGSTGAISSIEITDSTGQKQTVNISRISADIGVARNPNLKSPEPDLPEFLQRASEAIAGKKVNPARVYVSVVIFIISTIAAASLMYGGIRSAIISIGRNPLSKKSIIRGMFQVILTGLIIFISGMLGVYLLLKI
jgi:hypothetical protein